MIYACHVFPLTVNNIAQHPTRLIIQFFYRILLSTSFTIIQFTRIKAPSNC